ncbi:hypothetical protein [Rhabdochlamydiaceae symbiont of Dictyostelium giganteum]|uniref:hypothetical protein n=1 Tax=Rhabdochlamydiaceae symbiont of Dictyostelium giganteum TaxID=3342349 RepID=UPI00384AB5C0
MINQDFLAHLNRIFDNPKDVTMNDIENLVSETMQFFASLQKSLSSSDPKEKEQAVIEATQVQEKLNQLTEKAYALTGISKEKAMEILSNTDELSVKDLENLSLMDQKIASLKEKAPSS